MSNALKVKEKQKLAETNKNLQMSNALEVKEKQKLAETNINLGYGIWFSKTLKMKVENSGFLEVNLRCNCVYMWYSVGLKIVFF